MKINPAMTMTSKLSSVLFLILFTLSSHAQYVRVNTNLVLQGAFTNLFRTNAALLPGLLPELSEGDGSHLTSLQATNIVGLGETEFDQTLDYNMSGVWTFSQMPQYGTFSTYADPYATNVTAILCAESDAINVAPSSVVVTKIGAARLSTSAAKWGTSSVDIGGTATEGTSYLRMSGSTNDLLLHGDFTVEGWFYVRSHSVGFWNYFGSGTTGTGWWTLNVSANGSAYLYNGTIHAATPAGTVALNRWQHVAMTRSGTTLRLFFNGNLAGSATFTNSIGKVSGTNTMIDIGLGVASDNGDMDGFVEDVRVTKGVARYTGSFTPPEQPFHGGVTAALRMDEAIGRTWLKQVVLSSRPEAYYPLDEMFGQSSDLVSGDTASVSSSSMLGATAPETFNGRSLAITTNGTWSIPTPAAFGGTNFSVEMWFNSTSRLAVATNWFKSAAGMVSSNGASSWGLGFHSNMCPVFGISITNPMIGAPTNLSYNDGKWHHVVATRNTTNGAMELFVDAVSVAATNAGPTGARTGATTITGGSLGGAWLSYTGAVANIALYNKILSRDEIMSHYSTGVGFTNGPQKIDPTYGTYGMVPVISSNTTFYVATNGNDSNDGRSVATPWLTLSNAVAKVTGSIILPSAQVEISVADGSYGSGVTLTRPASPSSRIWLHGNLTNAANVMITNTSHALYFQDTTGSWTVSHVGLVSSAGNGIHTSTKISGAVSNIWFGACLDAHIWLLNASHIILSGSNYIAGDAWCHVASRRNSTFVSFSGTNVLAAGRSFGGAFSFAESCSYNTFGIGYGGAAATGITYSNRLNGVTSANGLTLPGSIAGGNALGGQFE